MGVEILSKDGCTYCDKVKKILELTSSTFVVYNLGEDFTKEEFIAEFGEGSTFPQVSCEGKKIGGSIETIQFLKEKRVIAS